MVCLHSHVQLAQWLTAMYYFIYGLVIDREQLYACVAKGLVVWLGYPFFNEFLLCLKWYLLRHRVQKCDLKGDIASFFPIVYTPKYNIRVLGLEKYHPFDIQKYMRINDDLRKSGHLTDKMRLHQP